MVGTTLDLRESDSPVRDAVKGFAVAPGVGRVTDFWLAGGLRRSWGVLAPALARGPSHMRVFMYVH